MKQSPGGWIWSWEARAEKTSPMCFVLWSVTFSWSPWLPTPRCVSCLQACLHARTWYFVAFTQLWSLGFSPWLGFALVKTLLGTSHRRPTWPSLNFCSEPILDDKTRKDKVHLGAGKIRMPHCWYSSSIPGLVWFFSTSWLSLSPCRQTSSHEWWMAACSSGLTASPLGRKKRVFSLLAPESTIPGNSDGLALVLGPLLGQGKDVLSFWLSWSLMSTPVNLRRNEWDLGKIRPIVVHYNF